MYASVSVDGFIADENDQPGPLFDWLTSGDVPLDDSGFLNVSQASFDYVRPYWDEIGATIAGRHVFDITEGWDGTPPGGVDHVVVVTHRPVPEGCDRGAVSRRRRHRGSRGQGAGACRRPHPSRSPPATSVARCLRQA